MAKSATARKQRYNKKAYDRTCITMKKGQLEYLKKIAEEHDYSVNGLITAAVTDFLWENFSIDFEKYPKPEEQNGAE